MHPGEVLKELNLDPLDMGAIAIARRLRVPRTRIERLVTGGDQLDARYGATPCPCVPHDPFLIDEHADKLRPVCSL
jgi:hypothetical protein